MFLTICCFAVPFSRLLFAARIGVVCLCFGWFVRCEYFFDFVLVLSWVELLAFCRSMCVCAFGCLFAILAAVGMSLA